MPTRNGEHLPRSMKPECLLAYYFFKKGVRTMRKQAHHLMNLETTGWEYLRTAQQDDQGDREEPKWRPFLQYPRCRETGRHVPDVIFEKRRISGNRSRQSRHDNKQTGSSYHACSFEWNSK